jgi:putative inorganic carbon (HCO3(-)) transporter
MSDAFSAPNHRRGPKEAVVAAAAVAVISLPWLAVPHPLVPVAAVAGIAALGLAHFRPFLICLGLIAFAFFRLHEAFPPLYPLKLPLALAVLATGAVVWRVFAVRSVRPFMTGELAAFLVFFAIVTFGVGFAYVRPAALDYWTGVFWKIALITFAIAWLATEPRDFLTAARSFVVCGLLVALVAISNKHAGIDLVEGTRVTIGQALKSLLADPNDLALVLLFPLSFAASLAVRARGRSDRLLGLLGGAAILLAIIYTQSRGGILGVAAIAAVFGFVLVRSRLVFLVAGGGTAVLLYSAMNIAGRISGGAAEEGLDQSAAERLEAWTAAFHMALGRPLTGVGLANFPLAFYDYSTNFPGRDMAPHSTWFGVLGETGWPGFVAFVVMVGLTVRSAVRWRMRLDRPGEDPALRVASLAMVAGLAGFCVAGTFLTQGFIWPLYIMIALTAALSRQAAARPPG